MTSNHVRYSIDKHSVNNIGTTRQVETQKKSQNNTSPKKTTSSPKKQSSKAVSLLPNSYLEILGSETPVGDANPETLDGEDEIAQMTLDKQKTLTRAMKAATDGDAEEASYLFRLHSKMVIPQSKKSSSVNPEDGSLSIGRQVAPLPPTKAIDISNSDNQVEKPFIENGVTFMPGEIEIVS